jgi:hypothetical protein
MEEGPPGTGCRTSSQTTRRCVGMSSWVVSGSGKGGKDPVRCGPGRRTRVNRRRAVEKDTDAIETRLLFGVWDEVQREPAYWLDGGRQRGGAILVQAFMRNVGTWRSDAKGEFQGGGTPRARVPMRSAGADQLVVVLKPGNAGGAKGLNRPASGMSQPARGGACA